MQDRLVETPELALGHEVELVVATADDPLSDGSGVKVSLDLLVAGGPVADQTEIVVRDLDGLADATARVEELDFERHQNGTSSVSASSAYMASSSSSTMVKKPLSRYAEQNSTPA